MNRRTKLISLIVAALAFGLAACGADRVEPVANAAPENEQFTETEWTIETPAGWTRTVITPKADAKKAVRYEAADGRYFIVAIDPLGSDFTYDTLWHYDVKGDRFEVVDRQDCEGKADQSCSDADARYDGHIIWKSGTEPEKAGGHTWFFSFGNSKQKIADTAVFEQIAESLRVTA